MPGPPPRGKVARTIRRYAGRHYKDHDHLPVFFAGHGTFDELDGQDYLVLRDSEREDDTRENYLGYPDLETWINRMESPHTLLVVDACYSGTLDERLATRGEDDTQGPVQLHPTMTAT